MCMSTSKTSEVVVITGASAGAGRAIVQAFARRGASIGLVARGHNGLEGARRDVEALGGQALVLPTDVANPDQVEAAADEVERVFGPIDIWVNDAMTSVFSPFKDMTPEEFRRVTEVTYLGCVYGTMTALHHMLPRNRGIIVQVGSALAYRGIPLQSAYCGAKHAIQGFTESVRCELIHDKSNVRISMVQMPALNTPQFGWVKNKLLHKAQPVPPMYQPEVAGEAIFWAVHHYRRELNVGLSTSIVLLGNTFFPGFGDWYLGKTGYKGQQTQEPADPNNPYNLWEPVSGDHGAHGTFDKRSHETSIQLWATTHRGFLTLVGASLASLVGAALFRRVR